MATYQDPTNAWHQLVSYPSAFVSDDNHCYLPPCTLPGTDLNSKKGFPLETLLFCVTGGFFGLVFIALLIRHCLKQHQKYAAVPKPSQTTPDIEFGIVAPSRRSEGRSAGRYTETKPSAPPMILMPRDHSLADVIEESIGTNIIPSAPPLALLGELESIAPIKSKPVVIPKEFECPISQEIMAWPTMAVVADGQDSHSYEKNEITRAFHIKHNDPQSGFIITTLAPNIALRHAIDSWWCGISSDQLRNHPQLRTDLESWIIRRGREHLTGELRVILDRFGESGEA